MKGSETESSVFILGANDKSYCCCFILCLLYENKWKELVTKATDLTERHFWRR